MGVDFTDATSDHPDEGPDGQESMTEAASSSWVEVESGTWCPDDATCWR